MTARVWRPQRARTEVISLVALAHLGLLGLLWRSIGAAIRDVARSDGPVMVWLPGAPEPAERRERAVPPRDPLPARRPAAAPSTISTAAPTPPGSDPAPGLAVGVVATVPMPVPDPTGPPPAPLRLTLPRGSGAASAPASVGSLRPSVPWTVESRIAAALGSGTWVEERLDDDRARFRQGERCVTLKRPRHTGIDPFNASMHPTPAISAGIEPCGDGVARR